MKPRFSFRCLVVLGMLFGMSPLVAAGRLPRTNLLVYHNQNGVVLPVESKRDWEQRRAEILRGFALVAGELPDRQARDCELDVQTTEVKDCGRYERRLISYQSEPGSRVPAYLCLPKRALAGGKNFPAVLCLHPTDMKYGHRTVVEPVRKDYRAYAHDLAARGFVTLAPAYPLMANYQPDLERLGWSSGTLKAVWDNQRALDLLDALPFVRHKGYGVIGHSLGGHNAIFTAAHDPRLRVVVSSCGASTGPLVRMSRPSTNSTGLPASPCIRRAYVTPSAVAPATSHSGASPVVTPRMSLALKICSWSIEDDASASGADGSGISGAVPGTGPRHRDAAGPCGLR